VNLLPPEPPGEPGLAKIVMPELPFDTSEGWFEAFCNCAVSKYDRLPSVIFLDALRFEDEAASPSFRSIFSSRRYGFLRRGA
jgi:hypothetical protein